MSATQVGPCLGRALDSATIETGLRELNPDIAFDVAVRKPGEFVHPLEMHPGRRRAIEQGRLPVCYRDTYVCAMDRGIVPEFKIWSVKEIVCEVDWADADQEGASIQYETIPPDTSGYEDLRSDAETGQHNGLVILADGRLAKLKAVAYRKVRGRVLSVGWRYTFYRLIQANIPGITAYSIGHKFGVDMLKYPAGPPEEVHAMLTEE